jgi:RNA polymerase sigma-70 factor (sigma-E family)
MAYVKAEGAAVERPSPATQDGARDALRTAFVAYYGRLVNLCWLLAGTREDAEEIVQEAFVRVAPRIEGLQAEAVEPYLRRTAINVWKNRLRRRSVERRTQAPEWSSAGDTPEAIVRAPDDELWNAVAMLPARQRSCVVLRFAHDLSERETARALGCSVGTVKSQTSKALARLRRTLTDED